MNCDENKYIILVKKNLFRVLKDDLYKFALENRFIQEGKYTKEFLMETIEKEINNDKALEVLKAFNQTIGYTGREVEDLLNITKAERTKWTKKKLLNVTGTYEVRAYKMYIDCPIYDGIQIINLIENGVEEIRNSIKKPTEKQLVAITKAREKAIGNRTCKKCGDVVKSKNRLDSSGLCRWCAEKEYVDMIRTKALDRRKYWLENLDKYRILDVETTGLNSYDEIVQIGVIDLEGNVLMDQLVKSTVPIPSDAMEIHGITDEMVKDCPTWDLIYPKVKELLNDKIIIAYNASFDIGMIENSCEKYNIRADKMEYECLMYNTMDVWGSERWIGLQRAIEAEEIHIIQDHRAIGDCMLCLELIKVTVSDYLNKLKGQKSENTEETI